MTQAKPKIRPKIRLYVPTAYTEGAHLTLASGQSHYLSNVMRVGEGEAVAVFNGMDGEWLSTVSSLSKKVVTLVLDQRLAEQKSSPDLWLVFAPIKNKMDVVVEKAVELGVSAIHTVYTHHTVVRSINPEKLLAYAIEAAEQCERHDVPHLEEHPDLASFLAEWPADRMLLYGDESGNGESLSRILQTLKPGKYAILIGPEGGFSADEHHMLKLAQVTPFGLGPRILRADTAIVSSLACIQAQLGDWHERPHFKATN